MRLHFLGVLTVAQKKSDSQTHKWVAANQPSINLACQTLPHQKSGMSEELCYVTLFIVYWKKSRKHVQCAYGLVKHSLRHAGT